MDRPVRGRGHASGSPTDRNFVNREVPSRREERPPRREESTQPNTCERTPSANPNRPRQRALTTSDHHGNAQTRRSRSTDRNFAIRRSACSAVTEVHYPTLLKERPVRSRTERV